MKGMDMKKAEEACDYAIRARRYLHQYPEAGFHEELTSSFIMEELERMKIPSRSGIAGTGIAALIEGELGPGRVIALRADMDGLPITEQNDVPYKSAHEGLMHACGHDAHMAMVLGAAKTLVNMKAHFRGAVKLIFQPAEEGPGGAEPLIKAGVLKDPDVDAIIAYHVSPAIETGVIRVIPGVIRASSSAFKVTLKGRGGHAAYPHLSVDPIALSAQFITLLQSVVARRVDPLDPAVITIASIHGGTRSNVIPEEVEMKGTIRALDSSLMAQLKEWMEGMLRSVAEAAGAHYILSYTEGYPALINDDSLSRRIAASLQDLAGDVTVRETGRARMGGEDFAFFGQVIPACLMDLGTAGRDGRYSNPLHHPRFDIDEESMKTGIAGYCRIVLEYLNQNTL